MDSGVYTYILFIFVAKLLAVSFASFCSAFVP